MVWSSIFALRCPLVAPVIPLQLGACIPALIRSEARLYIEDPTISSCSSLMMLFVTYARGASPHDIFFSCSSPFLIWGTLIFVTCLRSCSARVTRTCTTAACKRTNDKEWGRCTSRSADALFLHTPAAATPPSSCWPGTSRTPTGLCMIRAREAGFRCHTRQGECTQLRSDILPA